MRASVFVCVAMLPSLVLQRTAVRPYQRGLYCGDSSLSFPYQRSTVPSSVLTAVGLTLPVVSVSPAHEQGAHVSGTPRAEPRRVGGWEGSLEERISLWSFLLHKPTRTNVHQPELLLPLLHGLLVPARSLSWSGFYICVTDWVLSCFSPSPLAVDPLLSPFLCLL